MIELKEGQKREILLNNDEFYICLINDEGKLIGFRKMPYLTLIDNEGTPYVDSLKFQSDVQSVYDFNFEKEAKKVVDPKTLKDLVKKLNENQKILFDIETLLEYLKSAKIYPKDLLSSIEKESKDVRKIVDASEKRYTQHMAPQIDTTWPTRMFDDADWMLYKGGLQYYSIATGKTNMPAEEICSTNKDFNTKYESYGKTDKKLFYELRDKVELLNKVKQ